MVSPGGLVIIPDREQLPPAPLLIADSCRKYDSNFHPAMYLDVRFFLFFSRSVGLRRKETP